MAMWFDKFKKGGKDKDDKAVKGKAAPAKGKKPAFGGKKAAPFKKKGK